MIQIFSRLCLLALLILSNTLEAAPAYAFRVKFSDKAGTLTFADSLSFLTQKSLDRRSFQGIALDSTDLPVVPAYISQVMTAAAAVRLHNVSKWFNQIVVITYDSSKVLDILALPMVQSVKLVARYPSGVFKTNENPPSKFPEVDFSSSKKTRGTSAYYGVAFQQIDIMQGDYLHDQGYKGEGMDIAVFDVNFRFANTCAAFDSMNTQGRVKDVRNFARTHDSVFMMSVPNEHGMNVLGCMAANIPGTYVGTAPNANYHIYVTEDWLSEQPIEEDNWLSAAERADSLGVYLINSSVGYNEFNAPHTSYTYADMNGQNSLVVKAANMSVKKGIFVCVAQGNEGTNPWHYLITPADGDSVYSVGMVNGSGMWGASGYGPTFDGRTKPDGCGMGTGAELIGGNCIIGVSNGSSFSSPMLCGSIACLWQMFPNLTAFQLRRIVRMSSSQYTTPDHTLGYGIPNFELAAALVTGTSDIKNIDYTFTLYPNPCDGKFTIKSYDPAIENVSYALYDLQGNCIYKSEKLLNANFTCAALENAKPGNYHLIITAMNKQYTVGVSRR
ncbi:MAG: S8 family peptidase [Bacteroidetes bacterium]|nr:S8 family peptidase [Bacteroidota bacterium]